MPCQNKPSFLADALKLKDNAVASITVSEKFITWKTRVVGDDIDAYRYKYGYIKNLYLYLFETDTDIN